MMCWYPTRILSRSYYKPKIEISKLFEELGDFWIVRCGEGKLEDVSSVYGGRRRLMRDAFGKKIVGYSMNLLGGEYDGVKHIKYRPKGKGAKEWKGKKAVFFLRYLFCFKYLKYGYPIFFKASIFQGVEVPYEKKVDKKEYSILTSDAHKHKIIEDKLQSEGLVKVKGHTLLTHSPNNLNYWHIMLQTFPAHDDEKELTREDKWREPLFDYILDRIMRMQNYSLKPVEPVAVPVNYYIEYRTSPFRCFCEERGLWL